MIHDALFVFIVLEDAIFFYHLFSLSPLFVRMFVHRFLVVKGREKSQTCFCTTLLARICGSLFLRLFTISVYSSSSSIAFCFLLLFTLFIVFYFHRQQVSSVRFLLHGCFNPLSSPLCSLFISLCSFVCCCCCEIMWFGCLFQRYPCQRVWYCVCCALSFST